MTKTTLRAMSDLIERHCAHLRQRGLSDRTIGDRKRLLIRIDEDLPLGIEEALPEELTGWLAGPGAWTRKTKATYFEHVKGFFDWACDERDQHISWNPSASLGRPTVPEGVPRPVTDNELAEALRTAAHWRVAVVLAAYAGLRCCELATVTKRDVNAHTITVTGKGGKTRVIPTAGVVWEAVSGLTGRLVDGTPHQVSMGARSHFERVGLAGVTMHRFRSWFATTMLANGVDLLTVSKLLGHASTRTTAVYCQISDRQRASAVATLPVLAPAST